MSLLFDAIVLYIEDNYPSWSAIYIVNNIHIVNRQLGCMIIISADLMKCRTVIEPSDNMPNGTAFTTVRKFLCTDNNILQSVSEQIEIVKAIVASRGPNGLSDSSCE